MANGYGTSLAKGGVPPVEIPGVEYGMLPDGTYGALNTDYNRSISKDMGVPDMGMQQQGTFLGMDKGALQGFQAGMGGLATGYDIYDKLWGGGRDLQKAQIRDANTRADSNAYSLAQTKAARAPMAEALAARKAAQKPVS